MLVLYLYMHIKHYEMLSSLDYYYTANTREEREERKKENFNTQPISTTKKQNTNEKKEKKIEIITIKGSQKGPRTTIE